MHARRPTSRSSRRWSPSSRTCTTRTRSPCAPSSTTDYLGQCTAGSFHGFHHNFNASLTKRNSLQWAIFFIILSLLIGDAFRICGRGMPYTVVLLVMGVCLGLTGESAT